ncbi:MAG: FKBP-type peptidyl-prolyl cis-trans isomerase [Gemmiger sp.]|uniref:trigger factor n=1 Tax=Gemmiger sp. TaxID=2049027 RepID=UPI002E795F86|nr:FKBP-type peptidyl-prolyl cis-trans isomerase [Gemmiger sp.]MEE0800150.1 FKBP-type peptidyl-prolyl cis-trans isomerase [Gemmiger sp.]
MKRTLLFRSAAGMLAIGMALGLTACGKTATSDSSSSASSDATTSDASTAEAASDAYAYLADFSLSDAFDENGYLKGVTAADYVTLPDLSTLTLSDEANTVSEDDVNSYISDNILANFATSNQVTDRAAVDGDTVNIDYAGTIDGVAFDGGTATGYDLTLGSGTFIDGFEEQIVGHTPGETFDVNVTFPEDYQASDLAGKDAVFSTTLNYITETVTPDLTDEWVASNLNDSMGLDSVNALNTYVNDLLLFDQQANELYGELVDTAEVKDGLPEDVDKFFTDYYLYQPYMYSQMYGSTVEDFLVQSGFASVDDYLEQVASQKQSMINQILILQALAEQSGKVCDTDTMNAEFERYFGTADTSSYIQNYGENYLKMNILHDLVMQDLIATANA